MNRTKFFKKVIVNNVEELDFLWNTLSSFEMIHTTSYYRIIGEDVSAPDLISYKVYGTERYWWLICLVNNIQNPFADLTEGHILTIPDIRDIYDFYQTQAVR